MISGTRSAFLALLMGCSLCVMAAVAGDIQGKVTVDGLKSAGSIVVYLDTIPDCHFDPPAQHVAIHQKHMTFIPHVLPVMQGTTVDFYNEDSVNHGVSWPSISGNRKLSHHLGVWPQGETRSFMFNDPGVVPLLCYLHPEMSGYIVVAPTPYFSVTDEGGCFSLKDVPAGDRVLKLWSENGEPTTISVHVTDTTTSVNATVHHAHTR